MKINKQSIKVMELIDPYTGEMKCEVCGSTHFASIKPNVNGHYYRGTWQCQYKCKIQNQSVIVNQDYSVNPDKAFYQGF